MKNREWDIPEREATPEEMYLKRRSFLKQLGLGTLTLSVALSTNFFTASESEARVNWASTDDLYPADRLEDYRPGRPLSEERYATRYNNYYEFTTDKDRVWKVAQNFSTNPWKVEISGLVNNPRTIGFEELVRKFPLEERVYRFRCVERWAMVVPWTGFPLRDLIDWAEPLSSAKYVRFISFLDTKNAPGQRKQPWYPWPYFEALTIEEARNELAMMVTGIYGKPIPTQNGSPLRVIVPWKYGYKNPKAIQKIEFLDKRPETFWHKVAPSEYGFFSNVNPAIPHLRWSQKQDEMIGTGKVYDTVLYNGYGKYVAHMYRK